jgi:hypothetical protein
MLSALAELVASFYPASRHIASRRSSRLRSSGGSRADRCADCQSRPGGRFARDLHLRLNLSQACADHLPSAPMLSHPQSVPVSK